MSKVNIKRLDSVTNNDTTATALINDNFLAIQEAIENTLSRDGTTPNFMDSDLDLNSYRIINSADPTEDNDIVNLKWVKENIGGASQFAADAAASAAKAATSAQQAAVSAANSLIIYNNVTAAVDGFDNKVSEATQEFTALADEKITNVEAAVEGFDTNAEEKLNSFNTNAAEKQSQVDASAESAAESANIALEAAKEVVFGNIGDIGFAPLGIDETQNKRRYLNGQVISQTQFASFTTKVKAAIALYPALSATETNWQAEVTNSKLGQCGKFVIDDTAGTIRLPKVVNINGLADLSLMGGIKAESLPNITGETGNLRAWAADLTASGALSDSVITDSKIAGSSGTADDVIALKINASLSSSTYQDSAPVQQEAVQYPYFIQVATGSEESVDVSTEIQLNNPFSLLDYKWSEYELNNASWLISNGSFHSGATYTAVYELLLKIYNGTETKDGVSVKLSTEAYTDFDFVLNTADTTFRLPVKVKLASGNAVAGNGMSLGLTDGTNTGGIHQTLDSRVLIAYTADYGKTVGTESDGGTRLPEDKALGITTDPTKSGIETSSSGLYLYFYVGETVQDANVINAAGVLTDIANLKGYDYVVESYRNGTEWYRIYKSGWVEQGGRRTDVSAEGVTVTLLKPFIDVDYTVTLGNRDKYETPSGAGNRNEASFVLWGYNYTNGIVDWVARGQGE